MNRMEADWLPKFAEISHAVYVPHEDKVDASILASGIATLCRGIVRVFEVKNDIVSPQQGNLLTDALTTSDSVVVFGTSESVFIQRLAHIWPDYVRFASHSHATIVQNISLGPSKPNTKLASVFLVIPFLTSAHHSDRPGVFRLNGEDVAGLDRRGRQARLMIEVLGLDVPVGSDGVSVKDLCLLHHRDGTDLTSFPRKVFVDMVNDGSELSWRDLQSILQYQPEPWLVEHLRDRLGAERYAYGLASVDLLRKQRQDTHGVFPDIFSAVWYMERAFQPGTIFRGQLRAAWGLESTLLRLPPGRQGLDLAELTSRISLTEQFLGEAKAHEGELFGKEMDADSLLAIAQHFGLPTPLLDFTSSLRVAAFFATLGAERLRPDDSPIGVIFYQTSTPRVAHEARTDSVLHELAGIRMGSLRVITPQLMGADDRIGRQQGVFIAGYRAKDLQAAGIDRVYFKQQAGVNFEDARGGVSRDHLLAEDTRIGQFVASIRDRHARSHVSVSVLIGQTKVNDSNLIGSAGSQLGWHMNFGPRFLEDLVREASLVGSGSLGSALNQLIAKYFSLAHVEADSHQIPNEAELGSRIEPLRDTISSIEALVGLADGELWRIARNHLPMGFAAGGHLDIKTPENWTTVERLGLSCALFLAGWEHLRTVGGARAQELVQTAMLRMPSTPTT